MVIKTTLNINKQLREKVEEKYPDKTFTSIVEMGLELLLLEVEDPTSKTHIQSLVQDYNKLKKAFIEFRNEARERLDKLEN
jgi:hypothetical protein